MIILLLILILSGCSKSEVIAYPELNTKAQDSTYTPRVADSTETRKPIRFDVSIEDWGEITIE